MGENPLRSARHESDLINIILISTLFQIAFRRLIWHPILVAVVSGIIAHHLQGEPDRGGLHTCIGEDYHRPVFIKHHENIIQLFLALDLSSVQYTRIGYADRPSQIILQAHRFVNERRLRQRLVWSSIS